MILALPPALAAFVDPLAMAIVGGGTLLAVVLRNPAADLARAVLALRLLPARPFRVEPLIEQAHALARIARRHGLIALDRSVIADPDLAAAAAAAVDGASPDAIVALLRHARTARCERHRAAWEVWQSAAETAPAMGMVGTLIGLVGMFSSMHDTSAIGGAMAVALLATLYGALLASLLALPIANRLKRRSRIEAQARARLEAPLAALGTIEPAQRAPREIAA
ncbi:motility protein A [Sphingomonas sp. RS6]